MAGRRDQPFVCRAGLETVNRAGCRRSRIGSGAVGACGCWSKHQMITVSLIGGLGNQMFQYAAGKSLAKRHGVGLALDLSGFRNYALRSFLLDRLRVPEAGAAIAAEASAAKPAHHFARSLWLRRIDRVL